MVQTSLGGDALRRCIFISLPCSCIIVLPFCFVLPLIITLCIAETCQGIQVCIVNGLSIALFGRSKALFSDMMTISVSCTNKTLSIYKVYANDKIIHTNNAVISFFFYDLICRFTHSYHWPALVNELFTRLRFILRDQRNARREKNENSNKENSFFISRLKLQRNHIL